MTVPLSSPPSDEYVFPMKYSGNKHMSCMDKFCYGSNNNNNHSISNNNMKNVPHWSVEQVTVWVTQLRFPSDVCAAVSEAKVDGDLLLQLQESNLKEDLNMSNGIHRKRFLRELSNLKKTADYSSVDKDNLSTFLAEKVGEEYKGYAYNLIKHDLGMELMRRSGEADLDDMLKEAGVSSSIHRRKIMEAVFRDNKSASNQSLNTLSTQSSSGSSSSSSPSDVYVSFGHSAELASLVRVGLRLRGFTMTTAEETQGNLEDSLNKVRNSPNFILVLSCKDVEFSERTRSEVAAALQSGCNIVPVMEDGYRFPSDAPEDVKGVFAFNAVRWVHDYQEACLDKMERFLRNEPFLDLLSKSPRSRSDSGRSTPFLTPVMARKAGSRVRTISTDSAIGCSA